MLFKIFFLSIFAAVLLLSAWMFIFRRKDARGDIGKLSPLDGIYLLSKGNRAEALKFYVALASEGGSTPSDYLMAAVLMRTAGDAKGAVHVLESLLLRRSTHPDIVRLSIGELIRCYRITGSTHSAASCIDSVIERGHRNETILLEAMIACGKSNFDVAASKFQHYQKVTGTDTSKDISLVYTAAAKDADKASAVKHLKTALKHYPSNHRAFFALLSLTEEWELCRQAVDSDILRTREDMIAIENICYKLSKLEDLKTILIKKVQSGGAYPAPYLFLAAYYKKMGELPAAQRLVKDYITNNTAAPILKKNYANISNDPFLDALFRPEKIYCCTVCGYEFPNYSEICQICGEVGTVDYKL
jgi:tetratricopeptide (TPR) repeat protein